MKIDKYLSSWLLILALATAGSTADVGTGRDVLRAMHERYADSWYRTLTFVQKTERIQNGKTRTETWYEALALPGRFRIDIRKPRSSNVRIFARDSIYVMRSGSVAARHKGNHPLLLLGFDVYFLPAEELTNKLEPFGFDLSVLHEATWQDRPVYVVGAERGALNVPQFWVDKNRLVLVRVLLRRGAAQDQMQDIRFENYRRLAGGWIAPTVRVLIGGELVMRETYRDIRANVDLDERLFDPARWEDARWWQQ